MNARSMIALLSFGMLIWMQSTWSVSADDGKQVFAKCAACHSMSPGENKVGPSLAGVFGRTAGELPNYRYSASLHNAGIVWDEATLDGFLTNPRAFLPGTRMSFAGLRDKESRDHLIAWLREQSLEASMAEGMASGNMMNGEMMASNDETVMPMPGMMMPGTTGLIIPEMNPERGKTLFVVKGCVACHAINGVGGHDAAALDADAMGPFMNPFEFAAKMWRVAPLMVGAQEDELGGQILFTGDELADIIAFVHDKETQLTFSEDDLTDEARLLLGHGHGDDEDEMGNMHGDDDE